MSFASSNLGELQFQVFFLLILLVHMRVRVEILGFAPHSKFALVEIEAPLVSAANHWLWALVVFSFWVGSICIMSVGVMCCSGKFRPSPSFTTIRYGDIWIFVCKQKMKWAGVLFGNLFH